NGGNSLYEIIMFVLVQLRREGFMDMQLLVPQDEWSPFSPMGEEDDIPCRRMRSGSYVKAMADDSCDDSGDSDGSPKLSPKMQARRASYLKATQPSLTEMTTLQISTEHSPKLQIRSHSYLRAVSEVSINRSVDTLDPKTLLNPKMLLSSPQYRSRNESYMRAMSTISQVSELEVNGQIEQVCEQVFREMQSQAVEAMPMESLESLPIPGSFRMRSHSYVRAMDQGCSRDEEEEDEGSRSLLLLPASPPRTTATTVRTIQSSTVSSCITTYKKTPPPVPPRTSTCSVTSKPYISITAQSSTESAQDAYMEEEGQSGDMIIQSRLSNSTESIDSMKALTAAIDAANAQVHGPSSQHVIQSTITASHPSTTALNRKEAIAGGKCLSIGIQVIINTLLGFINPYLSIQTDLDSPDLVETPHPQSSINMVFTSSGSLSDQYSRDAASSTVSIQGSGNHYHACASDDYDDVGFDPSILPPPDPWIDSVADDPMQVVQRSVCQRDGHWFLKLLQAETDRMEGWCRQMELDQQANYLTNDMLGKVRSAVGSAKLLMSQKFQQFRKLCEENLNPNAHPKPMSSDLAGFWDMLQLSIENISLKFDELLQIRANNWRPLDPPERKEIWRPPPVQKKPPKGPQHHHPPLARDRSLESSEKQKQEARKRLMAVKRAASVRQNSATESADSIEIYIPEAQTRL
uniref:Discs, large (Drosophila) homolog-associated protein 1a n=1 Tax=Gadus morhua TaxID=8049 RepID=A0A8C5FJE8_GADMO